MDAYGRGHPSALCLRAVVVDFKGDRVTFSIGRYGYASVTSADACILQQPLNHKEGLIVAAAIVFAAAFLFMSNRCSPRLNQLPRM